MTTTRHRTEIIAPPGLPTLEIVREFDAPVHRVFRAHVDPDLVAQWLGPRQLTLRIDTWDLRRGGSYRYVAVDPDGTEYGFWGAVHDVQEDRYLTQTFGFDAAPESVSLDKAVFTDLGDGRTRLQVLSVVHDVASRDAMVASGMEVGVVEGYEQLDELLAGLRDA